MLLAVVALTGCTGSYSPTHDSTYDPSWRHPSPSSAPLVEEFGQTYTWPDGLSVTMEAPQAFDPGPGEHGREGWTALKWKVSVVNHGTGKIDATNLFLTFSQGSSINTDTIIGRDLGMWGNKKLQLPGEKATFWGAAFVSDPDDFVVEFRDEGTARRFAYFLTPGATIPDYLR